MIFEGTAPEAFAGRGGKALTVCGVFSSSVYLMDETGEAVLIHDRAYGLVPFGIGLQDIARYMRDARPAVGDEAAISRENLKFARSGAAISIVYARPSPRSGGRPSPAALSAAAARGEKYLAAGGKGALGPFLFGPPEMPGDVFAVKIAGALPPLREALESRGREAAGRALESLLGLGRGLTPTADDFLTGLVWTLLYARSNWEMPLPEAELLAGELLRLAPLRTNFYSAAYLRAAARGQTFSLLEDVLRPESAMLSGKALSALCAVGGSSGEDMLAGIVYGLKYISGK